MEILKFSAEWCQPCRDLKMLLDRMEIYPTEYDIDMSPEFVASFGIRSVPTLVAVDETSGEVLGVLTGQITEARITQWLDNI